MTSSSSQAFPLWEPSRERIQASIMERFRLWLEGSGCARLGDYDALYRWSVEEPGPFWSAIWTFCGVVAPTRGERDLLDGHRMPGARWFPDASLNFAENLLRRRDDGPALVFRGEDGTRRELSFRELHAATARFSRALREAGVVPGDRVAAVAANTPETVVAMLAAASLGAVWSSCSPDFGLDGILDRFGQIEPTVLLAVDSHRYKGRVHDGSGRLAAVRGGLPSVRQAVVLPYPGREEGPDPPPGWTSLEEFLAPHGADPIEFAHLAFDHPLYILFSSGTTGRPKCIVHGAGGTLLQHLKEHRLHSDVRPGDRVFYFTTCGWMMWNWLVSALASEATLILYDGSPFHPRESVLFDLARDESVTHFGISARYVDAVRKSDVRPRATHALDALRVILSTGSPLSPESFDFVYEHVKEDVQLASISGGTDIVSCFALGNPVRPVYRGELQGPGLGMKVAVYDDDGKEVTGRKGELVCAAPFPSMPVGFWNDPGGARYRATYFERFPGVWHHGDYAERTPHDGLILHGRSDATLNPGGVRIGTSEIYRQVERFDQVLESLAVEHTLDGVTRIVLFVKLREPLALDESLADEIRATIRANTSAHHVPRKIIQVADIPRTKSGKISELAVRDTIHGTPPKNVDALENPESLALFHDLPALRTP